MNYELILTKHKFEYISEGLWLQVGTSSRIQGWKIHLSTIPTNALQLFELILPFFQKSKLCFKIINSSENLFKLNEGFFGYTQIGKCITIYPKDDNEAKMISEDLAKITKGQKGPEIITDLRLGDVVYARYGSFNPIIVTKSTGERTKYIYINDRLVKDEYHIPYRLEKGVTIPFTKFTFPYPATYSHNIIGPGYLLLEVIKSSPKGGILLTLDVRSHEHVELKVLKQARAHCTSDWYGRDGRYQLKNQELIHKELESKLSIPKTDSYFDDNNCGYLPMEFIEGKTLQEKTEELTCKQLWFHVNKDKKKELLNYLIKICENLMRLHNQKYIHRDLSPSNILINQHGEVYFIDFEFAYKVDSQIPAYGFGTPGFISPNQKEHGLPKFEDDIFSIVNLINYVMNYGNIDQSDEIDVLNNILSIQSKKTPSIQTIKEYLEIESTKL
ncbi:class III lanthionine synthetase LanKC N-terminal domain-containing protein [Paenibacillus riograndensis]|nr:protein kinase [Paenibacillus riograndensis]